jgi:diaminopimelate epimerase
MLLEFTKMNGAGNDFVLFDNREDRVQLTPALVERVCDRHAGVGSDGIIGLVASKSGKADWAWQFFNSDGSAAEMCGNGARCFARYVQRLTGASGDFTFETTAGIIGACLEGELVTVDLTQPSDLRLNEELQLGSGPTKVHSLNTGVPHAVVFVPDADQAMVSTVGQEIRRHPHFAPRGTNVNFVQALEPGLIRVRTYERGIEGETLACGTGVTAAALVSAHLNGDGSPVDVLVQGGDRLEVSFNPRGDEFAEVRLKGPADFVFDGKIDL